MYKVFVQNKPVIFTESVESETTNTPAITAGDDVLLDIYNELEKSNGLIVEDLGHKAWRRFVNEHKYVEAAGGIVKNPVDCTLLILRNGFWDLPKGKAEKGEEIDETAIREVEEETGIRRLEIVQELPSTWHTYTMDSRLELKRTYWFEMKSDFIGELIPQQEEGITQSIWCTEQEVRDRLTRMFRSVQELMMEYLG